MTRGRPRIPGSRIAHGTMRGFSWHREQMKKDPDHAQCDKCKEYWKNKQYEYRKQRRNQRKIVAQVVLGGQARRDPRLTPEIVQVIEQIFTKYSTKQQKRDVYE